MIVILLVLLGLAVGGEIVVHYLKLDRLPPADLVDDYTAHYDDNR